MPDFAPSLVATYRLQLRSGVGLAEAQALLPWLVELGVSHLYLSPLFRAASGSTHGYDVIDPNEVDPVLGGEAAFVALADAARDAGIGIVLDIVPNHMGLTPENPYIADIMRHGRESRFAHLFDIDWDCGPLHFPVLDGTLRDLLGAGQIALVSEAEGPGLAIYGHTYPLRDTALAREIAAQGALGEGALSKLLAEQHWSVGDWRSTADAIVHRRFFNISSLIGVRQENAAVFDLTHRWIIAQVQVGRVQGLRVDHVDGLARPGGYLHRLRKSVGEVPVWIEKIVKDGERIPPTWPVEGMSGYEFITPVTQLLTSEEGLATLREAAAGAVPGSVSQEVRTVRDMLLKTTFAPELRRLTEAAVNALGSPAQQHEEITRSIGQVASGWPVYRSYTADGCPLDLDVGQGSLLDLLRSPDDPQARIFAARFEQLTGALTAKSEEDTVFYRAVSYLPFCEVGAEPDLGVITPEAFTHRMQLRAERFPRALNTLSTHDTKRSADARAAIIVLSHFPELAQHLAFHAIAHAGAANIAPRWGLYGLQTALIMQEEPEAEARVREHIAKAMRESKDASSYEAPDEAAETCVADLCLAMISDLRGLKFWTQGDKARFDQVNAQVVLAQTALQLTAPGVPDLYQGTEVVSMALTDPDNRRPIDWSAIKINGGASARKLALTRTILAKRRENPALFTHGFYELTDKGEYWTVRRSWQDAAFELDIEKPARFHPPSSNEAESDLNLVCAVKPISAMQWQTASASP